MFKRLIRRANPKPEPRDWEQEYKDGKWRLMSGLDEMSRYWVAVGYCSRLVKPAILDVGCGNGLLEPKLRALPYGSYVGLDISPSALTEARKNSPESCRFVCGDFLQPPVTGGFDRIVFMESLDSYMPAAKIFRSYLPLLRPDGRIIFSLYDGASGTASEPIWKDIRSNFQVEDATRLQNLPSGKSWTIAMIAAPC